MPRSLGVWAIFGPCFVVRHGLSRDETRLEFRNIPLRRYETELEGIRRDSTGSGLTYWQCGGRGFESPQVHHPSGSIPTSRPAKQGEQLRPGCGHSTELVSCGRRRAASRPRPTTPAGARAALSFQGVVRARSRRWPERARPSQGRRDRADREPILPLVGIHRGFRERKSRRSQVRPASAAAPRCRTQLHADLLRLERHEPMGLAVQATANRPSPRIPPQRSRASDSSLLVSSADHRSGGKNQVFIGTSYVRTKAGSEAAAPVLHLGFNVTTGLRLRLQPRRPARLHHLMYSRRLAANSAAGTQSAPVAVFEAPVPHFSAADCILHERRRRSCCAARRECYGSNP